MTACRCCGQDLPAGGEAVPERAKINVDEALLLLCHRAFRLADWLGSETVEVAHLAVCLGVAPLPDDDFQREGIDRGRLSEVAQASLQTAARCLIQDRDRAMKCGSTVAGAAAHRGMRGSIRL